MSSMIYSHPHLELHEHIEQVESGLKALQQWHSQEVQALVIEWIPKLAKFHDLGKGSAAFQIYIQDPKQYRGDPREKAHTSLSLFLTLLLTQGDGWDALDALGLAAVVRGHHTALPTIPERKIGAVSCSDRDINNFAGGESVQVLKKQLTNLDFVELERQTGLPVTKDWERIRDDPARYVLKIKRYMDDVLIKSVQNLTEEQAVLYRLKIQLFFSILLEADKALLAISNPENYLKRESQQWDAQWVEQRISNLEAQNKEKDLPQDLKSLTNQLRGKMRDEVKRSIDEEFEDRIFSLTAPTGCGKTLLAATWALKMQEKIRRTAKNPPKIIVVLPFLSVIDQTAKEYAKLLAIGGVEKDGRWLLTSHSLADRSYAQDMEVKDERFFVDTWRSELIITTYDQFLMSLMDPKARYQMRFHHLCDALIIMDEVQSLPCQLWQPLDRVFQSLVKLGSSKLLLMSATLPSFVSMHTPLVKDYPTYFAAFTRYKLVFSLEETISLEAFCELMVERLPDWISEHKRVLITLNTRGSARKIWQEIKDSWIDDEEGMQLFFISSDVTPKDRLVIVDEIKQGNPCIVVSTQSIEAGVDIDLDLVLRDFAPLDSLIQIAGRCNREGKGSRGTVEIFDIVNENERRYSEMIYDSIHLQVTRSLLLDKDEVPEENVLSLAERYFAELSKKKDTGKEHLERFMRWLDDDPVRELLRGKERQQFTFLVSEEDPELLEDLAQASQVEERWERREAWRALAGRIAMVSIQVFAKPGFSPRQIANEHPGELWILRSGYYAPAGGLNVEGETMIF